MRRNEKLFIFLFSILLIFMTFNIQSIYAAPNETAVVDEESIESEVKTEKILTLPSMISVKWKEVEVPIEVSSDLNVENGEQALESVSSEDVKTEELKKEKVLTLYDGETELFDVNSEDFKLLISQFKDSIIEDSRKGFELLSQSKVTLDHIRLDTWGEFLNKYYGKKSSSFPLGNINVKCEKYEFSIQNTEESRILVLDYIVPELVKSIEEISVNYPVYRYALDIQSGSLLKDYECDLSSVRLVSTITPFEGLEEYLFYNVGSYYGMTLGTDYVDILRGYIEGNTQGYDRPVEGDRPGCVNVLSYITLIKDVSNFTLSDKVLSDFMLYQDLAICLDTKQLVNTSDMTTQNKELSFSDFKLNPDNLILAPISNDVVILQPTYLECFMYLGFNKGLNRTIDITPFVSNGEKVFNVSDGQTTTTVPMEYFMDENGRLDTQLGRAPFLMYYSSHVPYDLMIDWAYNKSGTSFSSNQDRDNFVKALKNELVSQGRKADYNAYMKAAGQMTDTFKLILTIVILLVIIVVVVLIVVFVRKKLKESENENTVGSNSNQTLLFDDNDSDDDEDDDGGFELH